MPIVFTQVAGNWGSFAGDCCVIRSGSDRFLIDLGRPGARTQRIAMAALAGYPPAKMRVLVTHTHADHRASSPTWTRFRSVAKVFHGNGLGPAGNSSADRLATKFERPARVTATQIIYDTTRTTTEPLGYRVTAIFPSDPGSLTDENDHSLGALIEVTRSGSRVFSFLTLGDMTPKKANQSIANALRATGYLGANAAALDVIKLPHHGSENNVMSVIGQLATPSTSLLVSGYSGTAGLFQFLNGLPCKGCWFLLEEQELADQFLRRRFPPASAALARIAALPNMFFIQDAIFTCNDDGTIASPGVSTWVVR